jgi:hypothetical protein
MKHGEVYEIFGIRVTISTRKIRMPNRKEINRRIAEHRKTHLINLDQEYVDQKEVFLTNFVPYDGEIEKRSVAEKNWVEYLSTRDTQIESLFFYWASNRVLAALTHQTQLEKLEINSVGPTTNLDFLLSLPNLVELRLNNTKRNIDLSSLTKMPWLRKLTVGSTHSDVDWLSISKLTWLESLELGDSSPATSTVKIPGYEFLAPLKNLKTLRLNTLRPITKDYSALAKLTGLQELFYSWERGQKPTVEELAKFSPGLAQVAVRKAEWEKERSQPGFDQWKRIK